MLKQAMTEEKEIIQVVSKLYKTFKKVGVKNVINALDGLCRGGMKDYDENVISFIKKRVCDGFSVDLKDLEKSYLSNELFATRSMIMVLIKKHLDLSHLEISNIFNSKSHSIVSHAISDFNSKNERIKEHKIYLDIYKVVDVEVANFKEKLK